MIPIYYIKFIRVRIMRWLIVISCLLAAVFMASCSGSNQGPGPLGPGQGPGGRAGQKYVPAQVLVKFKAGTSPEAVEAVRKALNLETVRVFSAPHLYLMRILDGSPVEDVIKKLKGFKEVAYSEPNYIMTINPR